MIDYNIVKIEKTDSNNITVKHISLDHKLDFFMVIDSNIQNYLPVIENKILDCIIDKISIENTYKDFSSALEKINTILKKYSTESKEKEDKEEYLNILVSVLNENDFIFSNIGKSSLHLVKDTNETIEITDKNENKKEFGYIFEGTLEDSDILIVSSCRLLEYLSYSDFTDSALLGKTDKINKNIDLILSGENIDLNIANLVIKYSDERKVHNQSNNILEKASKILFKLMDNNFIKIIIAYTNIVIEKIDKKSKLVKNLLLIAGIIVATVLLFQILSKTIGTITNNDNIAKNIELLDQARKHKTLASDNYSNSDIFNLNIKASQDILDNLKEKKIFTHDLEKLEDQLSIIKKTFNRVERWEQGDKHLIYKIPSDYKENLIKVLKVDKKIYLITKTTIIGPILNTKNPFIQTFKELKDDEYIDATELKGNIILLTKGGKIVEFRKSGNFSFKDVLGQDTWEEAKRIKNYANNIYLVGGVSNQIFKHIKSGNSFKKANPYLKPEDIKAHKISDIAIDGGIYILKGDLSLIKFFSSPYKIEPIVINDLPENYKKSEGGKIKIIARKDLNYVYMLLNNRVWIFKPNTRFYKQTKSISYLGQIESAGNKISDFFVEKDGTIIILNKNGIYDISFNENDGKILVNN